MPKKIIITGSSKGIGLELAKYYLEKGHLVYACSRSEAAIQHNNYKHFVVDLANEASMKSFFIALKKDKVIPDILINNAAQASLNALITTPYETAQQMLAVNVLATFYFMRETSKLMSKAGGGRIVNFTSVAKPLAIELESVYSASKAAVEQLTKVAAKEFAPLQITVNALGPGPTDTNLIKGVENNRIDWVLNKQALMRKTTIEEIFQVVDFFIDDKSSAVTGQIVYLGGVS